MKIKLFSLLLLLVIITMSFTTQNNNDDKYTYVLTVTSLNDQTQNFDLILKSPNKKDVIFKDLKTPFEKKLGVGTYDIIVDKGIADGSIEANVAGVLKEKKWTWAVYSNKDHKMIKLQAGPEGQTGVLTDW
ncbi:hypothetical protein [Aquimarina sp. AU474]|uniref:hypothetical protein n=1 Tax=Aquimarina sp. AU474 TaxID=2108529 RepID=UPI0013589D16|nr:hypothetical protein [Aquimarina sp. AU474]